jgi:hypothetical protein
MAAPSKCVYTLTLEAQVSGWSYTGVQSKEVPVSLWTYDQLCKHSIRDPEAALYPVSI